MAAWLRVRSEPLVDQNRDNAQIRSLRQGTVIYCFVHGYLLLRAPKVANTFHRIIA